MEIVPRNLKKTIIRAKPIADSEAATVKISKANNSPITSSKYSEKKIKFKLTETKMISIESRIDMRFFRLIIIPHNPLVKSKK